MGSATPFTPEKLVLAVLAPRAGLPAGLEAVLEAAWGPLDLRAGPIPFTWSSYYDAEMGAPLTRHFVAFERLVDPADLAQVKEESTRIEERFSRGGRRTVNLDPGLLALPRFTLATTKDNPHRVPLARGIYAEVTLVYAHGAWQALPWTYPDWRSEAYHAVLTEARTTYKAQLHAGGAGAGQDAPGIA
jgi:hypothetical protein